MASPGRAGSRAGWGSLLSQAVAGVEARLDTILAEDTSTQAQAPPRELNPSSPAPSSPKRASSTNRLNDRLQERLARAMAAKAAGQKTPSTAPRSSVSGSGSPQQSVDVPSPSRASAESIRSSPANGNRRDMEDSEDSVQAAPEVVGMVTADEAKDLEEERDWTVDATEMEAAMERKQVTSERAESTGPEEAGEAADTPDSLEKALRDARLQCQDETHGYAERVDALESKLQFLATEANDCARKAALTAPAGVEKKLAEKDLQIVQLMQEGMSLAKMEEKLRSIVKQLRAKLSQVERDLSNATAARDKAEQDLDRTRPRARLADELERAQTDMQRRLDQAQRELSMLRPEVGIKDATIAELGTQLQQARELNDAAVAVANDQARERDQKRIRDLEETVAALQVEKKLVVDRAKSRASELDEKAERANERARALEIELKAEMQVMENKLEAMRVRAEEAWSGATRDSHAKLLRQMETLQTQYRIATENWQGIEATLLARVGSLEKERDEAVRRESDMRRKAREAAMRARRDEEEMEESRTKIPSMQEDIKSYETLVETLRRRAVEAETALREAQAEKQKQEETRRLQTQTQTQTPSQSQTWLEDMTGGLFVDNRARSPSPAARQQTPGPDLPSIYGFSRQNHKASAPSSNGDMMSRQPSAQAPTRPYPMPVSLFSPSLGPSLDERSGRPERVSLFTSPAETVDFADRTASPQQMMQDMMSVSTVAAGPSVQLVERMSAGIRRLESEKVAGREELARMIRQRDEARADMVRLMRELDEGRQASRRAAELETEVAKVKARYDTTLELLGEKSELVDELRADVEDVKAMYRDLVERTLR